MQNLSKRNPLQAGVGTHAPNLLSASLLAILALAATGYRAPGPASATIF
jgi:hypothetical protein